MVSTDNRWSPTIPRLVDAVRETTPSRYEAMILRSNGFRSLHEFFSIKIIDDTADGEDRAMPSRLISLAILVYWSIAAFCLLTWDVLPELTMGYPPDLRAITFASDSRVPVRWSIQVVDDPL